MKVFLMLVVGAGLAVQFVDAKKYNDATQMKEKQDTKVKSSTTQLPMDIPNKIQDAQLSAAVNQPSSKPSNIASNVKVPQPSSKQQSSLKLPDGIRIPADIPTGIPADIVGKATNKLKNHFGKSVWLSTPKPMRKSIENSFQ